MTTIEKTTEQTLEGMPDTATRAERSAAGKTLRAKAPRASHGEWAPTPDRPDPIRLLEEQNRTRVPELIPIRMGRMSLSPFAFLRGSAVVMQSDLSKTPNSGIMAQLCGDAHISNFGGFGSAEHILIFDVNDFDETLPGAWEWDVKRMAASIVVAGRENGYTAQENRQNVLSSIQQYQSVMQKGENMTWMDMWYARIDVQTLMERVNSNKGQKQIQKSEKRASRRTSEGVFPKLAEKVNGQYRIKDEPPLITHPEGLEQEAKRIKEAFDAYVKTLPDERKVLLNRYHYVDIVRKVVGVGSVGTRCWVLLFMAGGDGDDALFLQVKEADDSTLEPYFGQSVYANHGERVVQGQRLMQSSSDIFLGWTHGKVDLYVRQLRDMKLSADIATLTRKDFDFYIRMCASAHARSSDPAMISGYLGNSDTFAQAIARFAEAYADQTELDHDALLAAIKSGRVQAQVDV